MKTRNRILAGVVLMTAFAVAAFGARAAWPLSKTAKSSVMTRASIDQLATIARQVAQSNGGNRAATAEAVQTTRGASQQLDTGADVSSPDETVFFVTMRGNFVANFLSLPAPLAAPGGTILSFTYDPATQQIMDESVTNVRPDVAQLGAVVSLTP